MKSKHARKFFSLRTRLILLLVLAILPIAGLNFYLIQRHSTQIRQQAGGELMNVVNLLADRQNQDLTIAKNTLITIAQTEEIYSKGAANCQKTLSNILSTLPSFSNLGFADRHGDVYCSAIQPSGNINIADRGYFQEAIARQDFAFSEFQIGKITGKPGMAIGYPVMQGNQISGVAFVALNLNEIPQAYSRLNFPPGSTITITDPQGIVLARLPEGEKWIGKPAPENSMVNFAISSTQSGIAEVPGVDGIKRLYAYTLIQNNGQPIAYLFVGIPSSQIYAQANRDLKFSLFVSFIVALIAFFAAWRGSEYLISKRIYALLGTIKHFQDGDYNSRVSVGGINDEINELATSFNQMMDVLQKDIDDLRKAEERFHTLVENIPAVVYEATADQRGTTVFVNSRIKDLLGFSAEEWISDPELWFKQIYPEDRDAVLASNQFTYKTGEPFRMTYRLWTKDGDMVWVYDEAHLILKPDAVLQGIMIDITEQKKLAAQRDFLQNMAQELLQIEDYARALEYTLKAISEKTGWEYGEIWLPAAHNQKLVLGPTWASEERLKQFSEISRQYAFSFGEGLPGKAWQTEQPLWQTDLTNADEFIRAEHARELGIQTALAFPVFAENELLAVFGFFAKELLDEDKQKIQLIHGALNQLSGFFLRKKAEEQIRQQYEVLNTLYLSAQQMSETLNPKEVAYWVTRACVENFGAKLAWLGRAEPDGKVSVISQYPLEHPYPARIHVRWDDTPEGNGPTGRAIKENKIISADITQDPYFQSWRKLAVDEHGFVCSAAFPLVSRGHTFGALNLYSDQADYFTAERKEMFQAFAHQAAVALENARLLEETRHLLEHTQALRRIDMAITASLDLRVTFSVALDEITSQLNVDAACILLFNPATYTLEFAAGRGFRTRALEHTRLKLGEGFAGKAAETREIIFIPNLGENGTDFKRSPYFAQEGFISYYAVPLVAKGKVNGVLEIYHRSPLPKLTITGNGNDEWVNFMETLAGQVAIAIDNASLFTDLELANRSLIEAYDATIEGWSHALDLRDKETEGHTQRVTELTLRLARKMGIVGDELVHIRRGALLHDIGKMGVPDGILLKPGPLTDNEWEIMRKHPQYALEMLSPIAYLKLAIDIPYCHHEKWDGTGYPRGLKREQIPLAARIFAIVDVYDALTSDRPYRDAWSKEKTLEHIRSLSGSHFDPKVVEAFLELLNDGGEF